MKIDRYDLDLHENNHMIQINDGEWVKYEDHAAALTIKSSETIIVMRHLLTIAIPSSEMSELDKQMYDRAEEILYANRKDRLPDGHQMFYFDCKSCQAPHSLEFEGSPYTCMVKADDR